MTRNEILQGLNEVFRNVFEDETIVVREEMTAKDVENWDSVSHIDMICMAEEKFGIQLTTKEVASLKNVADLVSIIERKTTK